MDLTSYIENLRREFGDAADAAGPEARATAERLTAMLDSAVRLTLIEVLSEAADELTRQLDPGVVDVRMRGREPQFVLTVPDHWRGSPATGPGQPPFPPPPPEPPAPPAPPGEGEHGTARMTLRLPESLKSRIEQAAAASGASVNAWLVRALTAALSDAQQRPSPPGAGRRISGWVR
ncbi:toxin-antitoxin system HicB family antitoxin [Nonomuraea dietziae]|uniref:toxin-antitoxin system HicB family antitoxin n=1 Tax=Nonomuraea dietziae TaxID=65515 RepID=UPI0034477E91